MKQTFAFQVCAITNNDVRLRQGIKKRDARIMNWQEGVVVYLAKATSYLSPQLYESFESSHNLKGIICFHYFSCGTSLFVS